MSDEKIKDPLVFSQVLFEKMKQVSPAICDLELYEFCYALDNIIPAEGWASINLDSPEQVERRVNSLDFYRSITIKPTLNGQQVLDGNIVHLTTMLFVGLVAGDYSVEWVNRHFYFDVRGFFFLHRTQYYSDKVISHFAGKPFRQFPQKQVAFDGMNELGYKDFQEANRDIDTFFIASLLKLVEKLGKPLILAIAGQTAAGKTEIVERIRAAFTEVGHKVSSIEIDNFFLDRDYREAKGFNSEGKSALHFELFKQCLDDILKGKQISTPRYDFLDGSSSHDLDGKLKPGREPVVIESADVIFMEGNFPFLLDEIAPLIRCKVAYVTDDPIRLKRKWRRDMDLRKKYERHYFLNRYFSEQFIMAQVVFIPQMKIADMIIDTTAAAAWVTPDFAALLEEK